MAERVVLLHSALGDSRLWRAQVEALSPRYEVVAPDLPGHGETPMPTEEFSFVDFAASYLPGALVGNSMGGGIALRTALAHPELVSKLVLVAAGMPDHEWSEEIRAYWGREREAWERGDHDAATEENMEFWVAPEHRDFVRPQQRRAIELQSAHEEPPVRWPDDRPLSELTTETLVVVGDRDVPDFMAIGERIVRDAPNARLVVVEGAGHLVGVDRPDELNRLLLDFLGSGA